MTMVARPHPFFWEVCPAPPSRQSQTTHKLPRIPSDEGRRRGSTSSCPGHGHRKVDAHSDGRSPYQHLEVGTWSADIKYGIGRAHMQLVDGCGDLICHKPA
jgi:hypothetical protein